MPEQTQIPVPAIVPAPSDWTVPGNVELILKCVTATFTDDGAAGAWLPAVVLLSDSGHVIARALGQSVAAGGSADVSFFPRVGLESATPVPAGSTIPFAFQGAKAAVNVPLNTLTAIGGAASGGFGAFYTNNAATFAQASTVISGATQYGLNLLAKGHILIVATMTPTALIPAGTDYSIELATGNDGDESGMLLWPTRRIAEADDPSPDAQRLTWAQIETVGDSYTPPLGAVVWGVRNRATGGAFHASIQSFAFMFDTDNTYVG